MTGATYDGGGGGYGDVIFTVAINVYYVKRVATFHVYSPSRVVPSTLAAILRAENSVPVYRSRRSKIGHERNLLVLYVYTSS